MIKDRFGVVNEAERMDFEKKYQIPFGYELVTFNYRKAEEACTTLGKGHIVEKISTDFNRQNAKEIIYRI